MVTNSESRKLNLYARGDDFNSTVQAITVQAFISAAQITATQKKLKESDQLIKQKLFLLEDWPVILERVSTLRPIPTLVGGATQILRFIYQTEVIDYEWYPQNPLDRARLDTFLSWLDLKKDEQGLLSDLKHLQTFETQFLDRVHPFICGFQEMTICDVIAFFAIMPLYSDYLKRPEVRDQLPQTCRWANKVSTNEDIAGYLPELKLKATNSTHLAKL